MGKPNDFTGMKFNRLTVLKKINNIGKYIAYLCRCECGREYDVIGRNLTRGSLKWCECFGEEQNNSGKLIDMTGKKIGRLTVISSEGLKNKCAVWRCKCDCGEECVVAGGALRKGRTTSCGCYKKETLRERGDEKRGENRYEFKGDICLCYLTTNDDIACKLNYENYNKVKNFHWVMHKSGYFYTTYHSKSILMHRLLTDAKDEECVDHIDGDVRNNLKNNLRLITQQKNCLNSEIRSDNTSGTKGIYWRKNNNLWFAMITYKNNKYYLGYHKNKEDAIRVREIAELLLFKEYSRKYHELKEKYANEDTSDVEAIIKKKQESIQVNT